MKNKIVPTLNKCNYLVLHFFLFLPSLVYCSQFLPPPHPFIRSKGVCFCFLLGSVNAMLLPLLFYSYCYCCFVLLCFVLFCLVYSHRHLLDHRCQGSSRECDELTYSHSHSCKSKMCHSIEANRCDTGKCVHGIKSSVPILISMRNTHTNTHTHK